MHDLDIHLAAIQEGDALAFAHWVTGAECRLRLSLRSFAEQVDVEAITQETFLRVWQVAPRFEPDGRPDGLLRLAIRTARNLAISEVRRRKPSSLDPLLLESVMRLEDVAIPHVETDPLLREALKRCHEKLPIRQRSVLACRIESAGVQPDRDLAEGLGMTLNTFLQNFSRARRLLVECLQKVGIVPLEEAL